VYNTENGPISDLIISTSLELDKIYLELGYTMETRLFDKYNVWVCRMCREKAIMNMWFIPGESISQIKKVAIEKYDLKFASSVNIERDMPDSVD
jgi:hypothetical protein